MGVLGKGSDFTLIDLLAKMDDKAVAEALDKGWTYCGVVGMKDGIPGAKCDPHPDSLFTMTLAGLAFVRLVADRIRPVSKGDSEAWLESLYQLPDTREARHV